MRVIILKIFIIIFAILGFIFTSVYIAIQLGLTKESGVIDEQQDNFISNKYKYSNNYYWVNLEEWGVLKKAIAKDSKVLKKAAFDANISPRILVSVLVPEQMRLFNSEREIFKEIFAPLQILGNQNQFSWGIMGIKQDTAIQIEKNLKATSSPYYLGAKYEDLLEYRSEDIDTERFLRLTNEKDHYFNYLYASLYIIQIIESWKKSGYRIDDKPEILATLFNIGFQNSKPKENPRSGGSSFDLNGRKYSFGQLAGEFYYSNELIEEFPR